MKRQNLSKREPLRALTALELAADGKAPQEWRVFEYGKNPSDKGTFIFDEKAARLVMAAFAKKGSSLTMDYEHQALNASENGKPAPNSCYSWTPEVRMNAQGKPELWATNAKWTGAAADAIEKREYLYFSPAFETEDGTMRVSRIVNMALTNIPALDNQAPLVAASQGDRPMKNALCYKCSVSLKFPSDDDDGDKVACVACSAASNGKMLTALSAVIGMKGDQTLEAITNEIRTLTSFRGSVIAILGVDSYDKAVGHIVALKDRAGEVEKLTAQIAADRDAALTKELDGVIEAAATGGKIAPAALQAKIAPILALSGGKPTKENIAVIKDLVGTIAPVVATTVVGEKRPDGTPGNYALTAEDIQIAKLTGTAPNDIIEHQKKVAKGDYKGMNKPLSCILQP